MNKRISKEDYREAKGCLKRYNYNCINILNVRADIISISSSVINGLPNAPYSISNPVLNSMIQLSEDESLQKCIKEYQAVQQALVLLENDKECMCIFENHYIKSKTKWEILDTGMSARTYERRKQKLIYAVHNELKKIGENLAKNNKKNML